MAIEFTVGETARCTRGHFPGEPVVPGAFLLGKMHALLLEAYPEWRPGELKKVKFFSPLKPGEAVRAQFDDGRWPRVTVHLSRDGRPVLEALALMVERESGN